MLCVECAGIKEGNLVVDVCAAPGGKSTHAAEKAGKGGKVLARDISETKIVSILSFPAGFPAMPAVSSLSCPFRNPPATSLPLAEA